MARMVDGDKIVEALSLIAKCWSVSPFVSKEKHLGAVSMLREVEREVKEAPTLTQPNEWVSRVLELDELYTKLQTVTGFTAEQLLEMFKAGYTLEKPDYSKSFEEMARIDRLRRQSQQPAEEETP